MGWFDRVRHVAAGTVHGLYQAVEAPFGLAADAFKAGYEGESLGDVFTEDLPGRLGQMVGGVLGEKSGVGQAVGGLPEGLRAPVRYVGEQSETAYRNVISEPLSTLLTAGSLTESERFTEQGGTGGFAGLLSAKTWRDAYAIAQHRSPGQALALAFGTEDVLDPGEVQQAQTTTFFKVTSGTTDAVTRWNLDPTVLAGKGVEAGKIRYVTKPLTAADDVDKVVQTRRVVRFTDALDKTVAEAGSADAAAAQIRHRFFPEHPQGAAISTALAEAGDRAQRVEVLKGAMGDLGALDRLGAERADLANQVRRTVGDRRALAVFDTEGGLIDNGEEIARLDAELDTLYATEDRLARRAASAQQIAEQPRIAALDTLRDTVTRSDFYQRSAFAAPLRTLTSFRPQHIVRLESAEGDIQLARMLRKSDLPAEAQDALRGEYMRALTPPERERVWLKAEDEAVRSIAVSAGVPQATLDTAMEQAGRTRAGSLTTLRSRAYDGEGRSLVNVRGDGPPVDIPLLVTQQENVLPIVDLDQVRKAADRVGSWHLLNPRAVEASDEILTTFYKIWKPAQYLRAAWPVRVVIDNDLRILSRFSAASYLDELFTGVRNKAADLAEARRTGEKVPFVPGKRAVTVRGYELEGMFGTQGSGPNIFVNLASNRASLDRLLGRYEEGVLTKIRAKATGEWRSLHPTESSYAAAWENAVNHQIGSDAVARQFLEGRSVEDVQTWLHSTEEGQAYARTIGKARANHPERWLGAVQEQVESYLPTADLRAKALTRKATAADLAKEFPDATMRPVVHGEVLAQALGRSEVVHLYDKAVEVLHQKLGTLPVDRLTWHPHADLVYQAEVKRMVEQLDTQLARTGRRIGEADVTRIQNQARLRAVADTRKLLFDIAEESDLGHMLRFVSPFFSPFREMWTVWTGIAVREPAYAARLRLMYGSPEKAGLVHTDDNGQEFVSLPIPKWARDVPFVGSALASQSRVRIDPSSLNMMLGGLPGAGPIVQIPTRQIVKHRPDLASSDVVEKFIFPYGVPRNFRDLVLPSTARKAFTANAGEEDRAFRNLALRIYATKIVDFNTHKRTSQPTWIEAMDEAKAQYSLRTFAAFFSPVSVSYISPYQPYIDAYRQLQAEDPRHADERFLDEYGPEFFPLTQAVSRSVDGVPSTLEAYEQRGKVRDLVQTYPELGGLIIGADGAGEFNRNVYATQLESRLRPGSDSHQRESLSFDEFSAGPDVRAGWIEYGRVSDIVQAELQARGLSNINQAAAADLRAVKAAARAKIAEEHPAWWAEFNTTDDLRWTRRMDGMTAIAADPRMTQRPDIAGLTQYLDARATVVAELARRPSHRIDAVDNADIKAVWDNVTATLVRDNPAFGALWTRYLERDPLTPLTGKEAA